MRIKHTHTHTQTFRSTKFHFPDSRVWKHQRYQVRECAKFIRDAGRVYRHWADIFLREKWGGARNFFSKKKGDRSFLHLEKKGETTLSKGKKGQVFSIDHKIGVSTFLQQIGGLVTFFCHSFLHIFPNRGQCIDISKIGASAFLIG